MTVTQTQHHTTTAPTKTVTVPAPMGTVHVYSPAPESFKKSATPAIPRTTAVDIVEEEVPEIPAPTVEEEEEYIEERVKPGRSRRRTPNSWFGW